MKVEIVNPATGKVDHVQELMDAGAVESVLVASQRAFAAWSRRPIDERAHLLHRVAAELREDKDGLQQVMTAEMGKLRKEALAEIEKCAAACSYYADHAAELLADKPIATDGSSSYVRYEPIGCVFAVMPWNFPIWQVFRFLAPTLMAGNVAVLKHASNVPRCADRIAAVLHKAGIPEGVLGVLHVDNDQAAEVIRDRRIAAVTLTGSERAGRSVASNAGQQLKKAVMELGGSDAFIVLEDAELEKTAAAAVASRFGNAGQTCIAAKRFIVVESVADAFVAAFVAASAKLALGDPQSDATTLAPMARQDLRDELHRQVEASIGQGAVPLLGCQPDASHAGYPASILDQVKPGMPAYLEELFGPVASILRVRDEAEAVRVANDTSFGLGGSVWTANRQRGEAIARQLEVGAAFVNAIVRSDVRLPFGGTKRSGFGRELAEHGIHEFTNIKSVYVA